VIFSLAALESAFFVGKHTAWVWRSSEKEKLVGGVQKKGAWQFNISDGSFFLNHEDYGGNWKITVSIMFENDSYSTVSDRYSPTILVVDQSGNQVMTVNRSSEYIRQWGGLIGTIACSGIITSNSVATSFYISTLLTTDDASPNFGQETNKFIAHDLDIMLEYMGPSANNRSYSLSVQ
jgi:hypothetical protein